MKKNQFILPLIIGFFIITSGIYAQESNYITSRYDFIPGEKVIFFDDFASESIGDFPAQWLTNGSGEIVTLEKFPGKWLHITKMGYFIPEAKEDFTENFTIEFDFVPLTTDNNYEYMYSFTFYLLTGSLSEPGGGGEPGDAGFQIYLDNLNIFWKNWSMQNGQRFDGMVGFPFRQNEKYHVALWIQKQRVRMYANENKVLDVPRAIPAGSLPNIFRFESDQVSIPLISNFRIAAGLQDMRSRLLKDGKIVSYGILFDVNSDKLKPESYSTLKVISDILKEDTALKLQVVGHTDSDGDDASNLDLSKRRAASVKNELVSKFGADAARLETDGKGESEAIAENNSSVNKAKNRRVEFISIKDNPSISAQASIAAASTAVPAALMPGVETGILVYPGTTRKYKTVKIGTQTWMAENLALQRPAAVRAYDDNADIAETYGYLYDWETANKVCPAGWHLPSGKDWNILIEFLGGNKVAGGKMRETGTIHWEAPNAEANNSSGFSALPGGSFNGEAFFGLKVNADFWTADEWIVTDSNLADTKGKLANVYSLSTRKDETSYLNSWIFSNIRLKTNYYSVRCVKD